MAEVIVIVTFLAQDGKEDEAAGFLECQVAPTHTEDGCLLFALQRGASDPRQFSYIERWASPEQLEASSSTPEFARMMAELPEYFDGMPTVTVYEALPSGERSKGSLAGAAATA